MQKVKEFIRFHQIPNPLRQRLEEYFQVIMHKIIKKNFVINFCQIDCSFKMKARLVIHKRVNELNKNSIF